MIFLSIFLIAVFVLAGCGTGSESGNDPIESEEQSQVEIPLINGYVPNEGRLYTPSGELISTTSFTLNSVERTITKTYSDHGNSYIYQYNAEGLIESIRYIESGSPDENGLYSSNSYEYLYSYDEDSFLVLEETDHSIDGSIDDLVAWEYDLSNRIDRINYDLGGDGIIDSYQDFDWNHDEKSGYEVWTRDSGTGHFFSGYVYDYYFHSSQTLPYRMTRTIGVGAGVVDAKEFEYDAHGNRELIRRYNSEGHLVEYYELDYREASDANIPNIDLWDWYYF